MVILLGEAGVRGVGDMNRNIWTPRGGMGVGRCLIDEREMDKAVEKEIVMIFGSISSFGIAC